MEVVLLQVSLCNIVSLTNTSSLTHFLTSKVCISLANGGL